ncbi:MAG: signal peptide peptidase SppA [Rhodospirillales bacterium]|jgi:protease IV|nr:signal peptide peptidase SppA [Rhodospirillales bacterium]
MSLEADQLIDRRRLKRRLAYWRVFGIVAVLALVIAVAGQVSPWVGRDYVASLNVEGVILDDRARDAAIRSVAEDDGARALVVYIDSPGGSVVGGETLFLGLRAVAENKPVVALMGDVATSAGYMAALGADQVYARTGSLTGSIGVILQSADVTGLLEKLGIKPESVKSAPLKAQPNPMEPFSPQARQATREVVLDVFEQFVDLVAERRELPRDEALKLADGRVFTGRQAKALGLIDALGGEPEARKWLKETHGVGESLPMRSVKVEREDGVWRELLESSVGKTVFSERLRLDGLISLWQPDMW